MSTDRTAEFDQTAEWLGDMSESYNVTDYTDEQTTLITIDVDTLARRIEERIAARQAEALDDVDRRLTARIGEGCEDPETSREGSYFNGFLDGLKSARAEVRWKRPGFLDWLESARADILRTPPGAGVSLSKGHSDIPPGQEADCG